MILYIDISLENIKRHGKKFPWVNPNKCPSCNHFKLWGHGYVQRYFNDEIKPYWMKRWYCPHCKSVHTARPSTHYRRFQYSKWDMLSFLFWYYLNEKLPRFHTRQREQYWLKGFVFQTSRKCNIKSVSDGIISLLKNKIIPFTHSSNYFEKTPVNMGTYFIHASTRKTGFG
jgi:hypothetical protein